MLNLEWTDGVMEPAFLINAIRSHTCSCILQDMIMTLVITFTSSWTWLSHSGHACCGAVVHRTEPNVEKNKFIFEETPCTFDFCSCLKWCSPSRNAHTHKCGIKARMVEITPSVREAAGPGGVLVSAEWQQGSSEGQKSKCVWVANTTSLLAAVAKHSGNQRRGRTSPSSSSPPLLSVSLSWLAAALPSWLSSVRHGDRGREIEVDGGFSDGVSCHFLFLYPQFVRLCSFLYPFQTHLLFILCHLCCCSV